MSSSLPSSSRRALYLTLALSLAVAALMLALMAGPARAAAITVNTTTDENNTDGDCSLREAVIAANTNALRDGCAAGEVSPTTDVITIPAGTYTFTIAGANEAAAATGDLDLTGPTTINGAGARTTTVDAADLDRIFDIRVGTTVEISGLTITNGTTTGTLATGGGVQNGTGGTLTLRQVAISANTAPTNGGGISSFGGSTLTIADSTVSGNSASSNIGGIEQQGGTANISNSTISGNQAVGASGGVAAANLATMNIESSTIASNLSAQPGGGLLTSGGGALINVKNSIVSANTATNCDTTIFPGGAITSQGNNIDSANSCGFAQPTDKPNTDPLLGPLANNGGPTDTRALLTGSPAIDTGDSDQTTDQRGIARPQNGDSSGTATDDIGAFEKEVTAPTVTSIKPSNGAKKIPGNTNVTVTFSEEMDPSTLNSTTITLKKKRKQKPPISVTATVTASNNGKKATLDPSEDLKKGTYIVTVTTGAQDIAGNALTSKVTSKFEVKK